MDNLLPQQNKMHQIQSLKKKRAEILSLAPEKMLDRILSEKNPVPLVHSFPEEDLYFMIHEIGPEDSLPLLSFASNRQLDFILDQDIWEKDRMDLTGFAKWAELMMAADTTRFTSWLMHEKTDVLELFLHQYVELRVREHDEDPSDFGEGFTSFDSTFYFRFREDIVPESGSDPGPDTDTDSATDENASVNKDFIVKLLEEMAREDHVFYQNLILESSHILPAEAEEEAYRWRNVRLSEKGFLPFDEAVGIYQPISLAQLGREPAIGRKKGADEEIISTPDSPFDLLKNQSLYTHALAPIDKEDQIIRLQQEFAVLCNTIIAADQTSVKSRKALSAVVQKACGYIHIGLEEIAGHAEGKLPFSEIILNHPLASLFSLGFGCALKIKWQAEKWVKESWFKGRHLPLSFWGEAWLGVLGGVLIKKPLFFDNYRNGVLYREFQSSEDITHTRSVVNDIIATDNLLGLFNLTLDFSNSDKKNLGMLTYKQLILTLWARHCLKLPQVLQPLTLAEFAPFYKDLWDMDTSPGKISSAMKTGFLAFLSEKTGWKAHEITDHMGHVWQGLFDEIEDEYGQVAFRNLDPRHVHHFLLTTKHP